MGRGIRYQRELKKLTQEDLAIMLAGPWDQKKVSNLEKKQTIDEPILQLAAEVLDVDPASLRNYTPDGSFKQQPQTRNTLQSSSHAHLPVVRDIGGVIKELTLAFTQQREEVAALYERLLEAERHYVDSVKEVAAPPTDIK